MDVAVLSVKPGAIVHHALSDPVPPGPGPASVFSKQFLVLLLGIGVNQVADGRNLEADGPAWIVSPSFSRPEDFISLIT